MTIGERTDDAVEASQEQWRAVRRILKERRHELAVAAGALYPGVPRVEGTELLCRDSWVAAEPVELDHVRLHWLDQASSPAIAGDGHESAAVLPLAGEEKQFATYADAMGELDRPALFENRSTYRLVDADFGEGGVGRLGLTSGRYFEAMSVSEALAHEFAVAVAENGGSEPIGLDRLPLRAAVGDPCDLSRRPMSVAITTLTLRQGGPGEASFLLHWRDPAKVTHAGGMYQVMPVGIFQPADENPASVGHDLSLWPSMVREFSEELLGSSEDYSRFGSPIEYEHWPFFERITAARQAGQLQTSVLGIGVDPLSLVADLLAVAAFDADTFDELFGDLVAVNSEGNVVSDGGMAGWAFTGESVQKFSTSEPMQAAGVAVLRLAWGNRKALSL